MRGKLKRRLNGDSRVSGRKELPFLKPGPAGYGRGGEVHRGEGRAEF